MSANLNKILEKYHKGFYTKEDIEVLISELSKIDDSYTALEEGIDKLWNNYPKQETPLWLKDVYLKEASDILTDLKENRKRFRLTNIVKYAGIAAAFVVVFIGAYSLLKQHMVNAVQNKTVITKNKEHKEILLPDGTTVLLNAGSTIIYPEKFIGDTRNVQLYGEAYFSVTKNDDCPFIVSSKGIDVKVLGTSFNLKTYNDDETISVGVTSGSVQVMSDNATAKLCPEELFLLNRRTGDFTKKSENSDYIKAWISGSLQYKHTPLTSVIQDITRKYDCEIVFEPNTNSDIYVTGQLDNENIESVLRIIEHTTGFNHKKEGGKIILYKK